MSETQPPILQANHLTHTVRSPQGPLTILQELSLSVSAGERVAILGTSGAGKTTLLSLLAGLEQASSGEITLLGQALQRMNDEQRTRLRAGQVGFVFQHFQLIPTLTAMENVALPLQWQGDKDARTRAEESLQQVGLWQRRQHLPRQLSGGEQQRVALARAFSARPKILFADEPTGNLDEQTGKRVIELMMQLNDEHATTLVLVTHDVDMAEHCSRRYHLADGRLSTD